MRQRINLPHFNLKDKGSETETLIYLIYRYKKDVDGKPVRLKYFTGKKILPKRWKDGLPLKSLKYPQNDDITDYLKDLEAEAKRIVKESPLIAIDDFKSKLDVFRGLNQEQEQSIEAEMTIVDYFEIHISKKNLSIATLKKFHAIKRKLVKFSEEKGIGLTFNDITRQWLQEFTKWCYSNGTNSKNTMAKNIEVIVQVMKDASTDTKIVDGVAVPLHTNTEYIHFETKRIKTTKQYLTLDELEYLTDSDKSHLNETDQLILDYFLMMCWTGLRVSDIFQLDKSNFNVDTDGDEFIQIFTHKGRNTKSDNEVVIPVLDGMKKIVTKYNYVFPNPFSENTHRGYIKRILKSMGIDRKGQDKTADQSSTVKEIDIADKISNHTGRYTFINFMLNDKGVTPYELTKITGQSLKVLMGYERGNKATNAKKVLGKIKPKMELIKSKVS